jgi:hypothetical protein
MIKIKYSGWFQCRLATDPDDTEDRRGHSGWTFAFAGEPDLDRIIRFQGPVAPRSHGPTVGVVVDSIELNGSAVANHQLVSTPVELLDAAKFEGQNGRIASSAHEPIVPFHVRISSGNLRLEGRDPMDLNDAAEIARRGPNSFSPNSPDVLKATGINNPKMYRQKRKVLVQVDRAKETDPTRQAALDGRLAQLAMNGIQRGSLGFKVTYDFELRGPNSINDPQKALGGAPPAEAVWRIQFWMGGWDADALCGFVNGSLSIS